MIDRWHTQTLLGGNDVPPEQRGDCVRAAMTAILGLPIDAVENVQGDDWWGRWQDFVADHGFELLVIYPKRMISPPRGLWLCVVPSLALDGNHCVIAKGYDLVHDPGMKRRYTADEWDALWADDGRQLEGWILVPLDPATDARHLNAEAVLWVAALDRVPIEERIEWVAAMHARIAQINAQRTEAPGV